MIDGIVNVLKPTGMSSHDIIGQARRIFGMKKAGHAGTLDPLAAGVLPVYLGQATRLIEYGGNEIKTYHAEFQFGVATDTEDMTGNAIATAPVPYLDAGQVASLLERFRGTIDQTPSRFSAINIDGVKAYKLARQNVDFDLPSRQVTIYDIRLLAYGQGRGVMAVTCSKGTYMRSLIRDLGEAAGTCACMRYLVRVQAGIFHIADAVTLEALEADPMKYVRPMDTAIQDLPRVQLNEKNCHYLMQGRAVPTREALENGSILRVYGPAGQLRGIASYDAAERLIRPHKMFSEVL